MNTDIVEFQGFDEFTSKNSSHSLIRSVSGAFYSL